MRATSTFVSAHSTQALCFNAGLSHVKTVPHGVVGPHGINFDGAIVASGSTGVSVMWFMRSSSDIELFCIEPIQCSPAAKAVVETYLQ